LPGVSVFVAASGLVAVFFGEDVVCGAGVPEGVGDVAVDGDVVFGDFFGERVVAGVVFPAGGDGAGVGEVLGFFGEPCRQLEVRFQVADVCRG